MSTKETPIPTPRTTVHDKQIDLIEPSIHNLAKLVHRVLRDEFDVNISSTKLAEQMAKKCTIESAYNANLLMNEAAVNGLRLIGAFVTNNRDGNHYVVVFTPNGRACVALQKIYTHSDDKTEHKRLLKKIEKIQCASGMDIGWLKIERDFNQSSDELISSIFEEVKSIASEHKYSTCQLLLSYLDPKLQNEFGITQVAFNMLVEMPIPPFLPIYTKYNFIGTGPHQKEPIWSTFCLLRSEGKTKNVPASIFDEMSKYGLDKARAAWRVENIRALRMADGRILSGHRGVVVPQDLDSPDIDEKIKEKAEENPLFRPVTEVTGFPDGQIYVYLVKNGDTPFYGQYKTSFQLDMSNRIEMNESVSHMQEIIFKAIA